MKRATLTFLALAMLASAAFCRNLPRKLHLARPWQTRNRGPFESTQDARNTVRDLFPGCYVTGAHKVGK